MTQDRNKKLEIDFFLNDEEFLKQLSDPVNEARYIERLNLLYPGNVETIELAVKLIRELRTSSLKDKDNLKEKIWERIKENRVREIRFMMVKIAASILLLVGLGGAAFFAFFHNRPIPIEKYASHNQTVTNESRLILSDGQNVLIPEEESEVVYSNNGSSVLINDSVRLFQEADASSFNQFIVPYGKYKKIVLNDGTIVWLNSGSRLTYPPSFTEKNREVYIEGEAYFEVSRDETRPFIVKTNQFSVRVLGTRFSVQADNNEDLYTALLHEGSVSLSTSSSKLFKTRDLVLQTNQMASLDKDKTGFNVETVAYPENQIAWTKGYIQFNEENLQQVLRRLSRFYNIKIEYRSSLANLKISGKLDLKEDPERVLRGISIIADAEIQMEEEKYIIY